VASSVETLRRHADAERRSFVSLCDATERLGQRPDALRDRVDRFRL